jgi:hypothetical protein
MDKDAQAAMQMHEGRGERGEECDWEGGMTGANSFVGKVVGERGGTCLVTVRDRAEEEGEQGEQNGG